MAQTIIKRLSALSTALLLISCASDPFVIIGTPLPATNPAIIKIYSSPPASFREIAVINTGDDNNVDTPYYSRADQMMNKLKSIAASLGANGILIRYLELKKGKSIGNDYGLSSAYGGLKTETVRARSSTSREHIHGVAIFVLSEEDDI